MTREEVEAALPVFLAALREAGYPVPDDFARPMEVAPGYWTAQWFRPLLSDEVTYRAMRIALAATGVPGPCWWCWRCWSNLADVLDTNGINPCSLGDCRAPIEESA